MTRLAIGPANYAGQAHAWAKAVEQNLSVPADSFNRGPVRRHEFRFETDREIPAPLFFAPLLRQTRMKSFLRSYSHVAIDGYQTFFQVPRRRDVGADVTFLREVGFKVALIAHGTDVRDPDDHISRNEHSYFHEGDFDWLKVRREVATQNCSIARESDLPLFVSTPDLLHDLPSATWLPVVVNTQKFKSSGPVLVRRVPRVLHLPSRAAPPIKGTQYVAPVLERLAAEGLIENVRPGKVPHTKMPELVGSVDIVIDQLLSPTLGVATVEALASGRLVMTNLNDDITTSLVTPPLMSVDPATLERQLRTALSEREEARLLASAGPTYANRWHNGRESANRLSSFLGVDEITGGD